MTEKSAVSNNEHSILVEEEDEDEILIHQLKE